MRKRTVITEDFEGVDCELTHEPCEWHGILKAKVDDEIVIAYLVHDNDYRDIDDLIGDCMGRIVDAYNGGRDEKSELYALAGCDSDGEKNIDAVWYEHGAEAVRRYIEAVLSGHSDEDTVTEYEERDTSHLAHDGETVAQTARRYVTEDAEGGYGWHYVMQEDTMETVLSEMWEDPAYYPGNRDAVMLDVYSHSGQRWSVSGEGMQCRWDTSHGAGAWVPDKCLLKELDSQAPQAAFAFVTDTSWLRGTGKSYQLLQVVWSDATHNKIVHVEFSDDASTLHAKAKLIAEMMSEPTPHQIAWGRERLCEVFAKQFLKTYNAIISGDVYGCVVETFDLDGTPLKEESCWGFIGGDYAKENLKSEFFDPTCRGVSSEVTA